MIYSCFLIQWSQFSELCFPIMQSKWKRGGWSRNHCGYVRVVFPDVHPQNVQWFTKVIPLISTVMLSSCSLTLQKLFTSLFSPLCGAHRPTGSALFVVRATANPLAEKNDLFSLLFLVYPMPPRSYSLWVSLSHRPDPFSYLFHTLSQNMLSSSAFWFVVTNPPPDSLPPSSLYSFSLWVKSSGA